MRSVSTHQVAVDWVPVEIDAGPCVLGDYKQSQVSKLNQDHKDHTIMN